MQAANRRGLPPAGQEVRAPPLDFADMTVTETGPALSEASSLNSAVSSSSSVDSLFRLHSPIASLNSASRACTAPEMTGLSIFLPLRLATILAIFPKASGLALAAYCEPSSLTISLTPFWASLRKGYTGRPLCSN